MNARAAFGISMLMHGVGFASAGWFLTGMWLAEHNAGVAATLGFVCWMGLPFALCAAATLWLRHSAGAVWALACVSLVNWMIAMGSVYYEHVVMRPESQGGFLFVALPLFELLGTLVGTVLAAIVAWTRVRPAAGGAG